MSSATILKAPPILPENAEQMTEYMKLARKMVCDTSEQLTDLASVLSFVSQNEEDYGITEEQANEAAELRNYVTKAFVALNKTGARD